MGIQRAYVEMTEELSALKDLNQQILQAVNDLHALSDDDTLKAEHKLLLQFAKIMYRRGHLQAVLLPLLDHPEPNDPDWKHHHDVLTAVHAMLKSPRTF